MKEADQLRVLARVQVDPVRGCWLWTGPLGKRHGRGEIRVTSEGQSRTVLAYRFAYEAFVCPIPAKVLVCHKCDDGRCCNPEHLFLGTHADNMADMDAKGRRKSVGPDTALRGTRHPKNILSAAQVLALREAWVARDITVNAFCAIHAARLGVSTSLVQKIVYRKNWAWL